MKAIGLGLALLIVAGCGAAQRPGTGAGTGDGAGVGVGAGAGAGNGSGNGVGDGIGAGAGAGAGIGVERPCAEPAAVPGRDEAIGELLAGKPRAAAARLDAIAAAHPEELAAETLLVASLGEAESVRAQAERRLPAETVALSAVSLEPGAGARAKRGAPLLRIVSQRRNRITDDDAWFERHGLARETALADAPEHVPAQARGAALQQLFAHPGHAVALYGGRWLVATTPGGSARVFELPAALGLEVGYAQVVGEQLIVQLAYNGYASASGGRNGYLAAFATGSGALLWRSEPLVANAGNFVVIGDAIVSGYGFTAERDFVVVVDREEGGVRQKLEVHGAPSYLRRKGDRLLVRTYDTDYELAIGGAGGAAPVAAMAAGAAGATPAEAPVDPERSCLVRAAAAAIDDRDLEGLRATIDALRRRTGGTPLVHALSAAHARVQAMRERRAIDLWRKPPQRISPVAFARTLVAKTRVLPSGPTPRFVQVDMQPADPARDAATPREGDPIFITPAEQGRSRYPVRPDIPAAYGRESLRAVIPSGDHTLLIYGGRYLIAIHGYDVVQNFDLDALRHPPAADPRWQRFAVQDATYAQVVQDALYVCNGGGSYAREVDGKKGFVTAIDLPTGSVRWRSDPLVCNVAPFAIAGDYLVTGYGFTDESDFLYALRLADGQAIAHYRLASAPNAITLDDARLRLETYAHRYTFELR